ncbi:MAG TPA: hypothetical protein IAD48_10230 [Candidatus Limiplasma pullistercoris]|nr:hypothetical protein [Candidatus Limiplasma pullistercoris]
MKKNRFFALALSLLMALALPLGAFAEENEPDTLLEGLVTEVLEQGFVMEDIELGSVLLNVDETTVMDGILAEGDIEVGQYVFVEYDGRLTRSLPPQAHADRVGCYRLTGTVDLSLSMGVLLTGDPIFGDVIIRVDGSMPHLYQGMPITVYYNGVMAMSYPGQVTARHIVVPELTGTVSDRDSAGFTLTDADGNEYRVLLSEQTFTGVLSASVEDAPAVEEESQEDAVEAESTEAAEPAADSDEPAETDEPAADADEPTETDEPASDADEPAETDESVAEEPAEEDPATDEPAGDDEADASRPAPLPTVEWGDGDTVTVYYNGVMTRSLPPQVTALEVLVLRD